MRKHLESFKGLMNYIQFLKSMSTPSNLGKTGAMMPLLDFFQDNPEADIEFETSLNPPEKQAMQTYVLVPEPSATDQEMLDRFLDYAIGKPAKKDRRKMNLVALPERPKPREGRWRMPKRNKPGNLS